MKKNKPFGELFYHSLKKILLIMRIAGFLMILGMLQAYATDAYSQKTRLSLSFSETELIKVLDSIESKSEYFFLYNEKLLNTGRKVTINEENRLISDILDDLFTGTDVKYSILDRKIILAPDYLTKVSQSQQKQISGTVTDKNNLPLTGVNVVVPGTTKGVITGIDGKYAIEVPQSAKSLIFSYIGMNSQEISIGNLTEINVTMAETSVSLEGVVVVGYGTAKKVTLTGAISSISTKDIKATSSDNLSSQLAGKLPGLRVTQRTGEPGVFSTTYDIRGFGTPLIVVDGIVMGQSDFVRLDPQAIDQISVLKDASAAVYGVQAANGVILVTTKRGEIGKPVITYSGAFTLSSPINLMRAENAYEFASLTTQAEINGGKAPTATTYSPDILQKYKDGTLPSTNWYDLVTNKFEPKQQHAISVSGGSDKIRYYTSIGYLDELGIFSSKDMTYKKYNVRSRITSKITDNLEVELSTDAMMDVRSRASGAGDGVFHTLIIHALPTTTVYANNTPPYYSETTVAAHPIPMTTSALSGYNTTTNKSFQGILSANYKAPFLDGLTAKFQFGYYNNIAYTKSWSKKYYCYKYDAVTNTYLLTMTVGSPSTLSGNYSPSGRYSVLGQINYDKVFMSKHAIKASLVFEERHDNTDNLTASKQFAVDIDQFYAGLTNPQVTSSNITENDNQNVIGKLNYDYLSKYLVEVGFNYGGSSKFPKGKRWGFFPYTSLGWRISEEQFFKSALPFITNFKFRGSYGIMGDDAASTFQFLTGYNYPSGNYIINGASVSGLGFRGMPNPNITWFTAISKNIGFESSILNGLVNLEVDLFRRDRSGLLATRILTIPGTVGTNLPQENLNKDMREGFELVLGHSKSKGNLLYSISGNMSYTRGQNTHIERAPDANSYLNWRNNTTNRWSNIAWGYKYIGQFQNQDDLNNSPDEDGRGNKTLLPGDYKYEDVNKDGTINDLDQIPYARGTTPDIMFGINGSVSYKGFDMNFLLQGAANYDYAMWLITRGPLFVGRNGLKTYMDNWHHADIYDINSPWIPGKWAPAKTWQTPPSNMYESRVWTNDCKYMRLKSMEIGYTLPKSWTSKLYIQNLRIYVSGFNLLTLCKIKDYDPEVANVYSYPMMRDLTCGVNITF